jgi:hypothetical protein
MVRRVYRVGKGAYCVAPAIAFEVLIPENDPGSSHSPMCEHARGRSLDQMKKRLLFLLLVTGLLVLALGGWTVQGLRWAAAGGWARGLPQPA